MCDACMVLCMVYVRCMYGENTGIVRCSFVACMVYVQCIHDQDYSKEEQQTRPRSKTRKAVISSNRKVALVNNMVLKRYTILS